MVQLWKIGFPEKVSQTTFFQSLETLEVWNLFGKHLESLFGNLLEFTCEFFYATLEFVWKYHNGTLELIGVFMEIFRMMFGIFVVIRMED